MNDKWHGLIKIEEIQIVSPNGEILWEAHNLLNTLHVDGEYYILKTAFYDNVTGLPANFYFGLDNRPVIAVTDTMPTVAASEPSTNVNGYARATITGPGPNGQGQFEPILSNGIWVAKAPVVAFSATGGAWGPVSNLFLTTQADNSGYLIASVALTTTVTVQPGSSINVRMGLGLQDCPPGVGMLGGSGGSGGLPAPPVPAPPEPAPSAPIGCPPGGDPTRTGFCLSWPSGNFIYETGKIGDPYDTQFEVTHKILGIGGVQCVYGYTIPNVTGEQGCEVMISCYNGNTFKQNLLWNFVIPASPGIFPHWDVSGHFLGFVS